MIVYNIFVFAVAAGDNVIILQEVFMRKIRLTALLTAVIMLCSCGAQTKNPPPDSRISDSGTVSSAEPETTSAEVTTLPETTVPKTDLTAAPETSAPETSATTASTTAETTVTTTAPPTTPTAPTTTAAPTTTSQTTTAATTTAAPVTTTEATTAPPATLGVLGYDLKNGELNSKASAGGDSSKLIINEICAKNKSNLKDFQGDFPDWLEIYNPDTKAVNLEGLGLSDDASEPLKWVFPSVNIQAGGYIVVFCSDLDSKEGELHTNFKISGGNEEILLSASDGKKISSLIVPTLSDDETYGYDKNGSLMILDATPGADNKNSKTAREAPLPAPVLSKDSGFYSSSFKLSVSVPDGCTVYYTTDGSIPDKSSKKYTGAIEISDRSKEKAVLTYKRGTIANTADEQFPREEFEKATIVRAIAVDSKGKTSAVTTATYFVGSKIADKYKNVSVISVVSDPDGLYNEKTGIFVAGDTFKKWRKENPNADLDGNAQGNYNQRGRDWEREAHIDYFKNGKLEFSEDAGMRTHGGWSRNSQQKSLKFYFREDYGEKKLSYELFPDNRDYVSGAKIKEYKRFMIRNGGNDNFLLLYKDAWTQSLVKDFPFATQDDELVIAFIDGEYWGIYTLNEVYDNHYIEENYGIDSDEAVMIKAGELEEGIDSDWNLWEEARSFVEKNDMSKAENYEKACEYFDMDSLTEYIAFELYIGNEDWLWNNWAVFRSRTVSDINKYHDGRWRFMLYDTEFSMNLYNAGADYKFDIFTPLAGGDGHLGPMFRSLLKSDEFVNRFVLACEDVMNIAFNVDSASKEMDRYYAKYSPFIEQHFRRFVFWQSLGGIQNNMNGYKNWLKNRQNYFPEQMKSVLKLSSSATHTVSVSIKGKGTVYINKIPLVMSGNKWSGKYLSGYKITVEAVPEKGYEFKGWSGDYDGDGAKIVFDPKSGMSLTAEFEKIK